MLKMNCLCSSQWQMWRKWMTKVCVTFRILKWHMACPLSPFINFQAPSAHLEYSCFLLMSQTRVWPLSQWAQTAQGFVWWESPLATVIQCNFLIWSGNSQRYLIRQEGIPKTGQGIQCRVMEYTFCHFIIIFAKYNKWPNNPNWFKILMPHSISLAKSMNLEHSINVWSHERYLVHLKCLRNIKNKIPWFSGHDINFWKN